jgi:hypothetical protein
MVEELGDGITIVTIVGVRSYRNGRGTPRDYLRQQRESNPWTSWLKRQLHCRSLKPAQSDHVKTCCEPMLLFFVSESQLSLVVSLFGYEDIPSL